MRIFYFAYWYDREFIEKPGGPIKVYEYCTNLTLLGYDVFLFIPKIGFPEEQTSAKVVSVPFIDIPVIRFLSFQLLAYFVAIYISIRYKRPNIVHVRIMWSFLPMIFARIFGVPTVLEVNDSPHRGYDNISNRIKKKIIHMIDRTSIRLSDHILPVTQKIAYDLHAIDHASLKIMTVISSGTNSRLFKPMEKGYCCRMIGLNPQNIYIGFVGSFIKYQGVDILIKCAKYIICEYPKTHFIIVGTGVMKTIWEKMVEDFKLSDRIMFTGHVKFSYVPIYCGAMDICVAPFLNSAGENSPVKVYDYLSCGKPVVMSNVGDTYRQFEGSNALVLVKPEDPKELGLAIIELLSNSEKRRFMGEQGRRFILSGYDRSELARQISNVYVKLLH